MSEPPKELVTLGKLFESNNSISDYEKDARGEIATKDTVVYPLTPAQIDHINKYAPNPEDDDQTAAMKAQKFDPEFIRSSLFDRIKARFSEKYLNDTVALLGYNIGESSFKKVIDKFTVNQVLNHIFKVDIDRNNALFSMEKFRHRPIFCGVNVLYDPGKKYDARDITFSSDFLGDLQSAAGNPDEKDDKELVALFTRNGFSVGISSVDSKGLGTNSENPAQYSRIFINNYQRNPIYDYNTTLMRSKSSRLDPNSPAEEKRYERLENRTVLLERPALKDEDGITEQTSHTDSKYVDHPCIIFAGDTLTNPNPKEGEHKGYELATYTAVPLCSWEYFINKSEYAGTKAKDRLAATNQCGPFTRVIAEGFYSNAISNILQTYTEIDLKLGTYKDKDGKEQSTFGYMSDGKFDWENVHPYLRTAAEYEYENTTNKVSDKNSVNDIALYESAYYRSNKDNYLEHIKNLFNATVLPLRFAFFRTGDNGMIHIRQYPAMPLLGALPIQDDYITQLVPVYRSLNETPTEETGMNWYINPHDILINGVAGSFYNVSQQGYVKKTYPSTDGEGVMFTYTGHLYRGPEKGTNLPDTIEAIHMGVKINDSTVALGEIDTSLQYKTDPIMIAPNNYLRYMTSPTEPDESRVSREAYKEFIKLGCVWYDSDGDGPEKNTIIPDTNPIGIDLSIYADIEKTDKKTHSKATEESEKEVNKKSLTAAIIVLVVLVALVVIFIIYRVIKRKNAAAMGIAQGFFCGD